MSGKLNDRQKRFADEYLIDFNATEAAKRAGYSEKTAYSMGSENLKKPEILAYIEKRKKARINRTQITQDKVIVELAKIAFADGTDFATVGKRNRVMLTPTEDLPMEKRAAVASVKKGAKGAVEVKTYDKVKALELLGRHLGLWDKKTDAGEVEDLTPLAELLKDE
ncbi:MAG: terminase small subunit [Oscillospiraceae bacterium]|nr:terminase small subunit [Oscillospiraceae bacterium]